MFRGACEGEFFIFWFVLSSFIGVIFILFFVVSALSFSTQKVAFADLKDDMDLAEDYLKYLVAYALGHCQVLYKFFWPHFEPPQH